MPVLLIASPQNGKASVITLSDKKIHKDILEKIYESVRCFSAGDELSDDMTLAIVRRKATGLPNSFGEAL